MYLILCTILSIAIVPKVDSIVLPLEMKWNSKAFPDNLDWRTRGVVTPVVEFDLGPVNGLVMVETIESLHAIATGNLQRGSFARVFDCCKDSISYECIRQMGGICTYDDYPTVRGTCDVNACKPFASLDTVDNYSRQSESVLLTAIQKSTLMVGFAVEKSFELYQGGIYREKNCSQTEISHVLQLVGYGITENNEPYWIAKNSWGKDWGENGYIRIFRGENICGIAAEVYQPGISAITTTTNIISTTHSRASETSFSLYKLLFIFCLFYLI